MEDVDLTDAVRTLTRVAVIALAALLPVPAAGLAQEAPAEALHDSLRALLESGDYARLREAADAAVEADPRSIVGWQHLGYALQRLGRPLGARRAFETVLELDPDDTWTLAQLGQLLARGGEPDAAIPMLRRSVHLDPASLETWRKLSAAYREGRRYAAAAEAIEDALDAGIDPAWCFAELGYLHWATGDAPASLGAWRLARRTGADPAACDHGEALARWEFTSDTRAGAEEQCARRDRRRGGVRWALKVGRLLVQTLIGPDLPPALREVLEDMPARYEAFLGLDDLPYEPLDVVRVDLTRTLEDHEDARRERFPGGSPGQAYLESLQGDRRTGSRQHRAGDRRPRDASAGHDWEIHVCGALPSARTGLSHELVHALLRSRHPFLPVWVDEGLATHLELPRAGRPVVSEARVRGDLLETLRTARERGQTRALSDLLVAQRAEFDGPLGRARYAEAWTLVHFLMSRAGGGRRTLLRFLEHVGSPNPERGNTSSFRAIYGDDLAAVEAAWLRHVDDLLRD